MVKITFLAEATSALLNGLGYVTYDFGKDDHFLSYNKTLVAFRFLTKWKSGVILHTSMDTNLFVVEIAQGNVVVHINLGSGELVNRRSHILFRNKSVITAVLKFKTSTGRTKITLRYPLTVTSYRCQSLKRDQGV